MRIYFPTAPPDGLLVEVHDLGAVDDDPDAWMADLLGDPAPLRSETTTDVGWPMTLAHAVARGPDGAIRAHRVGAFFRCFHFSAAMIVGFADLDELSARLPAVVAWWQTGRPDLRDDTVLALGELWATHEPLRH